jgi:hypothetical protein
MDYNEMLEDNIANDMMYESKKNCSGWSLPKFILGGRVFNYVTIAKRVVGRFGRERINP